MTQATTLAPPAPESRELGIVSRELAIRPGSFDEERRTVDVVFTTGARRTMVHWRGWDPEYVDEELATDRAAVRLDRINRGGPVLNSHSSFDLSRQIGVVVEGSARMEGGEGVATLRLSNREDVAGIVQDIRDGIIRNISVGYIVHRYDVSEPETRNDRPLWRAVDWEPVEISFVPIPADAGAGTRSADPTQGGFPCLISRAANLPAHQEVRMTNPNELPAGQDAPAVTTEVATRAAPAPAPAPAPAGVTATLIRTLAGNAMLPATEVLDLMARHDEKPFTHDELVAEIGKRWAAKDEAPQAQFGSPARVTVDERDKVRGAAIEAIVHRGTVSREPLKEGGELFRGRSLVEIGAELAGLNTRGKTRIELVDEVLARSTHVTSDFPLVLAAVSNKFLRNTYEAAPRTFLPFTRVRTVADFKNINVIALGDAPRFLPVPEGGEIKFGTMGEDSAVYAVASFGRALTVSRRMLVNDDMDAFSRLPQAFGRAAADLEGDTVYPILTGNFAMRTGGNLFQTGAVRGANLAATGTAITVDTVGVGEAVMMNQRGIGPDGTATGGSPLNIRPAFIITGTARSVQARQLVASTIVPNQTASVNPFAGQLQPIVDSRVPNNMWFLAADYNAVDTLEIAYLEGAVGPTVSQFPEVTRDGIVMRALHDFGASAIDYRGLYRNPGA